MDGRCSYLWENPNHAGAVIATLIPFVWGGIIAARQRGLKFAWTAFCVMDFSLLALLALTQSRSACLGWLGAIATFAMYCCYSRLRPTEVSSVFRVGSFVGPRVIVLVVLTYITGLSDRFASIAVGDGSTVNRLSLWSGGLKLVSAAPFTGWGKGSSGWAYMQWAQNVDHPYFYGTMVNSYLNVAVEFGLIAGAIVGLIVALPLFVSFCRPKEARNLWVGSLSAAVIAFSITSFFSTLIIEPTVVWAPGLSLAGLYLLTFRNGGVGRCRLIWRGALAWCACVALAVAGIGVYTRFIGHPLVRKNETGVLLDYPDAIRSVRLAVLPDQLTLGANYGREIRRMLAVEPAIVTTALVVELGEGRPAGFKNVLAFGPAASMVLAAEDAVIGNLMLVMPLGLPPSREFGGQCTVVLPDIDEFGYASSWREWAIARGGTVIVGEGCGQDATAVLTRIGREWINDL